MLRYVAAGIDGSPESLAAAHWAAREAARRGTGLRLVHAWEWLPHSAPYVPAGMSQRQWAEEILERASSSVRAAHPELRVIDDLVVEPACDVLCTAAGQAELLVLGSRGLGGLAGFLLGSVSRRVVARSPGPVVLVRADGSCANEHLPALDGVSPDEISALPYRDIVLGIDVGRPCDELIEFAFETALRCGASLRAMHFFPAPPGQARADRLVAQPGPELLAEKEHALVATLRPWCEKFPDVVVTETVAEGRAAGEMVRASTGAALVVVGRRLREGRFGAHVGSVAHAVLHHARCPVAVVPHS